MASSGSFSGSICSGHYVLRVDWSQTQDVTNNQSTITAKIYLVNDYSLQISARTSNYITIDETKQTYNSAAISTTGTHLLNTVTQTVSHNSDGSKSLELYCYFNIAATLSGTYYSAITASATVTLDTIPRASSISMDTGTMGSASTITITRASSAFTHTLTYTFGGSSGTIATQTSDTSVSWTPALTLANQIPNATFGTGTLTCTTYNGSTSIGSKSITITLKIPASVVPTISSLTATRVDGDVPSSWGIYVQTKSKATLEITGAAGVYSSTIASYNITGGGFSGTSSSLTTGYLNTAGTITFTATVTDSRGRTSAEATVSISVVDYSTPSFTSYLSQRCNSSGTLTNDGTYVKGTVKYSYAACSSKNSVTRATYYRKSGATTWTNASKSFSSGTAFTFGGGKISAESTYEIKYQLTDAFTTISVIDTVSTASVVMDFKSGGTGVAVGKVSEYDSAFEVAENWDVRVYGMLLAAYITQNSHQMYFGTCSTSSSTAAKTVPCTGFTLVKGAAIFVKFTDTNTASSITLNVNGTGAATITTFSSALTTYYWEPDQTLLFIYDGTYWVSPTLPAASTTYYGITMLSTSVTSTSTDMAATPSAVKAAYDRNSWDSISLTNALAIAYGGTGATTAAGARSNLGIAASLLYSGTLTTGNTTFSLSYKAFVIIGQPSSTAARVATVIPASQITTSATSYQITDESNYYSFNLSYSGTTVTLAYRSRNSSGQIIRVYGIN
jgi:hypothetical protein